jgi:hypothetical protein
MNIHGVSREAYQEVPGAQEYEQFVLTHHNIITAFCCVD